jgi:hypothetical protein
LKALFLKDRKTIVVATLNPEQPGVVRVDLESGRNETIGASQIRPGRLSALTELSPDGKRIGILEMAFGNSLELQQPRWMDVEGGAFHDIGKPVRGFGHFSWLPDGSGFVLAHAVGSESMNAAPKRIISLMRIDGTVAELGEGDVPIVLRKSAKILYRGKLPHGIEGWMTMDFQGSHKEQFSDGLTNCFHAAVSSGESKVFFSKQIRPGEMQPFIVDVNGGEPKPVSKLSGFFGEAAWR